MIGIRANDGILSLDECEYLISYIGEYGDLGKWSHSDSSYWQNRIIELKDIEDPLAISIMLKAYKQIRGCIPSGYEADSFALVVWRQNTEADLHIDEVDFEWREYSSIIYLNDDFVGGKTEFPDQEVSVTPKAGMGIVFEANSKYPHLVTAVDSGTRYTIASFWTNKISYKFYEGWLND
jgi:hypothetical protein